MTSISNEYQLQLILQAFEKNFQLNIRKAVRLYNVLYTTLSIRINGVSTCANTMINSRKLTMLEEEVIVQEILDLDLRRFPLWIYDIENIANRLLTICDAIYIGLH